MLPSGEMGAFLRVLSPSAPCYSEPGRQGPEGPEDSQSELGEDRGNWKGGGKDKVY